MENTKEIMENTKEIEDEDSICDLDEDEDDRYQYYEYPIEEEHCYKPEQKMSLSNGIGGDGSFIGPTLGIVILVLGILLFLLECGG